MPIPALQPQHFPLLDDVIALTDIAMASHAPARIVPKLVDGLGGVLSNIGPLPGVLLQGRPEGYARRELYRSPRHGYQILAITWAPGQASGIHDHADAWGVEAVLHGQLEVVDYRIAGRRHALSELYPVAQHTLGTGSVIGLLPPHDLHSCRNAATRQISVSLHVYGQHLHEVMRYAHVDGAHYRSERTRLASA